MTSRATTIVSLMLAGAFGVAGGVAVFVASQSAKELESVRLQLSAETGAHAETHEGRCNATSAAAHLGPGERRVALGRVHEDKAVGRGRRSRERFIQRAVLHLGERRTFHEAASRDTSDATSFARSPTVDTRCALSSGRHTRKRSSSSTTRTVMPRLSSGFT